MIFYCLLHTDTDLKRELRLIFTLKVWPHGADLFEDLWAGYERKEALSLYFITYPEVPRNVTGVMVLHLVIASVVLIVRDIVKAKQSDWRFFYFHTFVPGLFLSVDSGRDVMSICGVLSHYYKCYLWGMWLRDPLFLFLSCAEKRWTRAAQTSSSCQKRNTYFKFVQILIILKNLYPLYILNVYITYIFFFRTKRNSSSLSRVGQIDYRNALFIFQSIS